MALLYSHFVKIGCIQVLGMSFIVAVVVIYRNRNLKKTKVCHSDNIVPFFLLHLCYTTLVSAFLSVNLCLKIKKNIESFFAAPPLKWTERWACWTFDAWPNRIPDVRSSPFHFGYGA